MRRWSCGGAVEGVLWCGVEACAGGGGKGLVMEIVKMDDGQRRQLGALAEAVQDRVADACAHTRGRFPEAGWGTNAQSRHLLLLSCS